MDIGALTQALTTTLIPLLPYLLKAGEKVAEEAGKKIAGDTWEWAKDLWARLRPKVEAKPSAIEAARDVAQTPDDADAQAALRMQIKKLLAEDEALAKDVTQWLESARAAGISVTASGDRSVAIGGDVSGSNIVTGDSNIVKH
jgi:hypothetical protein